MADDRIPIGKFSLITRLSPRALRIYDERGLLVPNVRDIITGYRYYTGDQIPRGVSIKSLCSLGFSLADVEKILNARDRQDKGTIHGIFPAGKMKSVRRSVDYRRSRRFLKSRTSRSRCCICRMLNR